MLKGGSSHSTDGQVPSGQHAALVQKAPALVPVRAIICENPPLPNLTQAYLSSVLLVVKLNASVRWLLQTHSFPGSSLYWRVSWYFWPCFQM